MNKLKISLFLLLLGVGNVMFAQSSAPQDYFVGKWSVIVEGTPQGDAKMVVKLERKDGKLGGAILDTLDKEVITISSVEELKKDSSVRVNFKSQGFDVFLVMERKTADSVAGNMLDMFDAPGVRVREKDPLKK